MKTALVIDDSKSARFAMRKYLESNDYEVLTAESPDEAFQQLQGTAPSVIFLDHIMPGVEGFSVLQKLKSTPGTGDLPVVVCSSNEGASFVEQAIAHGAAAVLQKPPSPEQMAQVLRELPKLAKPTVAAVIADPAPKAAPKASTPPPDAAPAPAKASSAAPPPRFGDRLSQGVAGLREQLEQQVQQTATRLHTEIAGLREQMAALRDAAAAPTTAPATIEAAVQEGLGKAEAAWLPPLHGEVKALHGRIDALESKVERQLAAMQETLQACLQSAAEARVTELAALEQRLREAAAAAARAGVEQAVEEAATRLSEQVTDSILAALGQPSQGG